MNARDRMQELVFDCEMQTARRKLVNLVSSIDDGCDITIETIIQLARWGQQAGISEWTMEELIMEFVEDLERVIE